jgi:hypothetical protein
MQLTRFAMLVFVCTICGWSGVISAQTWEIVSSSPSGVNYFIDPSSIVKRGSTVDFTQLSNHPNGFDYDLKIVYSVKTFRSANCTENVYRSGYLIGYSEINARGSIVLIDLNKSTRWRNVVPESASHFMQERVCGI